MQKLINFILEHRYWSAIGVIVSTTIAILNQPNNDQLPRQENGVVIAESESPKQSKKSGSKEFIPVVNAVEDLCGELFEFIYSGEHVKKNDSIIFYVNGSSTGWVNLGKSFNFDNNLKNLSITYRNYDNNKKVPIFKYQCSLL